jgi:hypothetical protein
VNNAFTTELSHSDIIIDEVPVPNRDILGDDFTAAVRVAGALAREDTLKAGVPVFYRDSISGIEVMEQPDGLRFEIRFLPGAPRERNYEVLRELGRTAG